MGKFAVSVGAWASQTKARTRAVYRRSIDMLAEQMTMTVANGGRVPFQTGNLARSLLASTKGMPDSAGTQPGIITANLELNQQVWLGYQANYARRVNNGFVGQDALGRTYNQQGAHFVEGAIAEWPNIVRAAAQELQTAVESRK